jgi:hypothetical protein
MSGTGTAEAMTVSDQEPGFAAEADMLGPIAAAAEILAGPGAIAMFEVQAAAGVPDVVAAVLGPEVMEEQAAAGFVTGAAAVAALLVLSHARQPLDPRQVAAGTGLTPGYIRTRVLPGLAARGLAVAAGPGRWAAARRYRSPARRLVTVEAKLSDWRRGLGQAARHAAGADEAWLVLGSARTRAAATRAAWFRAAGVGLAGLARDGTLEIILAPGTAGPPCLPARRELLAQRIAQMHSAGTASGPVSKVFGRDLTTSAGTDPRQAGAHPPAPGERPGPVNQVPGQARLPGVRTVSGEPQAGRPGGPGRGCRP